MNRLLWILPLSVFLAFTNCLPQKPGTGHQGEVISAEAQKILLALKGKTFTDKSGVLGGGKWKIGRFAVIPNPVSAGGKGPVLQLKQGNETRYLPMEQNGDVADFYKRVMGEPPKGIQGSMSDAYKAIWKRRTDS